MNVKELVGQYESLSFRERGLVVAAILATTWMMWALLVSDRVTLSVSEVRKEIKSLNYQVLSEKRVQQSLRVQKENSPDKKLTQEHGALSAQIEKMDAVLGEALKRFVDPEVMPVLLEDVIRRHKDLSLKRIVSLPVEPVDGRVDENGDTQVSVYRHPMLIEFEGGYFQVLAYLSELEASSWKFSWRDFDYQITNYPQGAAALRVETLSREKGWIGV